MGQKIYTFLVGFIILGKDSPLDGDESSDIGVIGGRPGPSSHCCLSNRVKSNSKIQMGVLTEITIKTLNRRAREN